MRCCFDFTGPRWLQNMKWKEVGPVDKVAKRPILW